MKLSTLCFIFCLVFGKIKADVIELNVQKISVFVEILDLINVDESAKSVELTLRVFKDLKIAPIDENSVKYLDKDNDVPWIAFLGIHKIQNLYPDKSNLKYDPKTFILEDFNYYKLTFGCDFEFDTYPFDIHDCPLKFICKHGEYFHTIDELNIGSNNHIPQKSFKLDAKRIPFKANVTQIEPKYFKHGDMYMYQISFHLERDDSINLMAGYFIPTGIFPYLALLSFLIDPKVVPGRLGLMITLLLISFTMHAWVDAPPDRGLSNIEIWMLGNNLVILAALFEYGFLLVRIRYVKTKPKKLEKMMKKIDLNCLLVSGIYCVIFQVIFWVLVFYANELSL